VKLFGGNMLDGNKESDKIVINGWSCARGHS
jgi:hypothetical protein